jgi:hypothetical protein
MTSADTANPPPDRDPAATERGHPASITPAGEVHGSGAGAGGGGTPEDFDADSAGGGGGDIEPRRPAPPGKGADAPSHNSR